MTASTSDSSLVLHTVHVRMHVCMYACGVHKERERESCTDNALVAGGSNDIGMAVTDASHVITALSTSLVTVARCSPTHHTTPTPHYTSTTSHQLLLTMMGAHQHITSHQHHITRATYHITLLLTTNYYAVYILYCLQCFDAIGWAAGRASGL